MNILHLTDFHFKSTKSEIYQQEKIIDKIVEQLHKDNAQIDFIFFTGDLVFSGTDKAVFETAKELLIDRLLREFNLNLDQFFICPGNHDVDRTLVSKAIISQIDSFKSNADLEKFIKPIELDFKNSLQPLSNYEEFVTETFIHQSQEDIIENGYSTHIRNLNGKKIGIFCANTAWRAIGHDDEGNLIVPPSYIKSGLANLRGCDLKIFLHHHPIVQFRLYNQYEIEDLIHNNFNISFCGHLHKDNKTVTYTNKDGILKLASAAVLADSDGSTIGYTLLNLDMESFLVSGYCYKYDRQEEFFYHGNAIELQVPISQEKEQQNKFRQRLRELYELELENADDLFLNGKSNKEKKGFKELWTNPVISSKSPEEVKKTGNVPIVNCDDLLKLNNNYLIMGDDKCGKTSLLKKFQLDCFALYNSFQKIPLYIDAKKIDKSTYPSSKIDREIQTYYSTSKTTAQRLRYYANIVLLIDNLDLRIEEERAWLQELVNSFNSVQVIICTDQNSGSKYQDVKIGENLVTNLYFHNLKKKQIRELAEKFYGSSDSKLEVISRINHIFTMLAIPFNFWSVSLFMWVFKDTNRDITNDVDLVDLYIESILEREKLIKNKSGFSYDKYKQYLARLSKFFLMKSETAYAATRDEIYIFTKDYLDENPRNNTDANSVWDYVESKGIVKQVQSGLFTFRLNGVFEYFLAHYLKLDSEFRESVINDDNVYLSFRNELEMYAGSNRGDIEFVEKIFEKTKTIFFNFNKEINETSMDTVIKELGTKDIALQLEKSDTELLAQELTQDEVDIIDESMSEINSLNIENSCEVKIKQFIPIDETDLVSLERALYILGRVFKNADDIKNTKLINDIFDYLITTTMCWGYRLFKSFIPENLDDPKEKNHVTMLVKLMRQMLPIIVQSRLSDMIGANNMQLIIKNKLKAMETTNINENQFKRFILLYTLADIDLINNYDYIQTSIDTISIPILKYAILTKILYYYNFRLIELNPESKQTLGKKLQAMYKDAGARFNNKLYTKESVNRTFQKLDRNKIIYKGRKY